jgi:N-acyl-D-aspartate/D-glutamate deacylase
VYDLIIKNGMVIDPSQDIDDQCDIAISQGKIAAIENHIPSQATKIINANNQYVTPGLIDLHTYHGAGRRICWLAKLSRLSHSYHCLKSDTNHSFTTHFIHWPHQIP